MVGWVLPSLATILMLIHSRHRRKMETEGKAKVVASVWGAKFVQFLAALAVLSQLIEKNG